MALGIPVRGGSLTKSAWLRSLTAIAAVCVLLAVAVAACTSDGGDSDADRRMADLEAMVQALADENAELKDEVEALRRQQADFLEAQEAAEAATAHEEEVADFEEGQEEQIAAMDSRLHELEEIVFQMEQRSKDKDGQLPADGSVLERTARLAEDAGGEVYYVEHPGRGDRTVLVLPLDFVDGETPLIVSLHGYGGNSADHAAYVPLHKRVNTEGFALLLPNGALDMEGNPFWNPTDHCCDGGKSGEDDVAYLTELVAETQRVRDFGPVYFFGYSNGGFMSYHMACRGLPGLRAVASLAGTSYVEDSSCEGAPPVSVLHVHGAADEVILIEGDETEPDPKSETGRAFYAGAQEMVTRWSRRAGCDWPENPQPYLTLDLDEYAPGPETEVFRVESGCAEGIVIELWVGEGSGHAPDYGDAFVDALAAWLLSQE